MSKKICRMCGDCCRKGGPALHKQDAGLISNNVVRFKDLVCIRAGEIVRDNQPQSGQAGLIPLAEELVKLAPAADARPHDWTCRFLTRHDTCFIYSRRPAECQALECRQPQALLEMSGRDRLSRLDILDLAGSPAWLAELVAGHEQECAYSKLAKLAENLDAEPDARLEFLRVIEYDRAFRELAVEKAGLEPLDLNFLFGRPLLQTVIMYGLDARPTERGISLVHF